MPEGVSGRVWAAGLLGPAMLAASLGVQLVLAAVLVVDPPPVPGDLTPYGRYLYLPDRDIEIFVVSTILVVLLGMAAVWAGARRRGWSDRGAASLLYARGGLAAASTTAAFGWFLAAREFAGSSSGIPGRYLAVPALLAAATIGAAFVRPGGRRAGGEGPRLAAALETAGNPERPRLRPSLLDLAVPAILVLAVYVPDWRQLAGRFFYEESLFHWDFFAMGPALAFSHGQALGTDAYSMYGVGWPMLFGWLSPLTGLSYGRMIQIGSLYACVWLAGVYLLLRLLVRRPAVAALGTGVILLQLFLWQGSAVIWRFPSLTVMRWAFDVWCFLAVVLHWRSGRRPWAVVAGAAVGMALLFATDTGLYLAASLAFYWLCSLRLRSEKRTHLLDAGTSVLAAAAVLVAGLALASRGGLLTPAFLKGWLEAILEFGGGFAQLPMATVPNAATVAAFVLLFFCYVVVVVYCLARLAHRSATHFEVFNGFVAAYGLLNLLHFVGRSGDYTPFRLWIPLAIVATNLGGRLWDYAEHRMSARNWPPGRRLAARAAPFAAIAVVVLAAAFLGPWKLLLQPVQDYPNLGKALVAGRQPDGLCVFVEPRRDLCGLPERQEATVLHLRAIFDRLEAIEDEGGTYAVVDETGSLFYLGGGGRSFSRYPRIFIAMYNRTKVDEVKQELESRAPDFVLTRPLVADHGKPFYRRWRFAMFGMAPGSLHHETWEELNEVLRRDYRLQRTGLAPFELWERVADPAAGEPTPASSPG